MERPKDSESEFFTAGEMGRRMNVSVRTLQYYDREGLLRPSALSEGGRRLYTYKDMVTLHQIRSLKHLGFSLSEIREKLLGLDEPQDVAEMLSGQAQAVRDQIESLTETLGKIEKLREEVLSMNEVDFRCYADIVINLEMRNDLYWAIKYFDAETRDQIRAQFDAERGHDFLKVLQQLQEEAVQLKRNGSSPASPEAQNLGRCFWEQIMQFTDGQPQLMDKLLALHNDDSFRDTWESMESSSFLEEALGAYLQSTGTNPFGGGDHD